MLHKKNLIIFCCLFISIQSFSQIEVTHVKLKDFKAFGFGAFLNFAIPVSDANYATIEGGLQYFQNADNEDLGLAPVLLGYRYTFDHSGTGFYIEPNAGYCFGASSIQKYDQFGSPIPDGNGGWQNEKVAGPVTGVGLGYLFQPGGKIQFNVALRYQHTFGNASTDLFAFRISHAFTFGRRNE
ncbi:MAG: hypothetical protein EKK37_16775 [Sphingobacteriales bacterium]|nr:MAG: hypothetical protein EKK37_16775 [Sphingobacteriales bacterium]